MSKNIINAFKPKLFELGASKKLMLLICALILWILAYVVYSSFGLDYYIVASFNLLRTNAFFAGFWHLYTNYMLYVISLPLVAIYLAAYKVDALKPYRLVLFLALFTTAIGTPLVDPLLKDFFAHPRPWELYPDINSLNYVNSFSFPSGHSFQAFSLTLPLVLCFLTNDETFKRTWKKTIVASILLVLAITLAFSRILAGVHFLSDVLFGIGLAIILTIITASLLKWLLDTGKMNIHTEKWYAFFVLLLFLANFVIIR